jgi:hypothetical protein
MNVVQLHERVRFWADVVGSPRFETSDIDNAINVAMNDLVEEKYYPTRIAHSGDSFQRSQRTRDELSALVKESDSSVTGQITLANYTGYSIIPITSFPVGYKYLLAIALYNASGTRYNCWPITYDRINVIDLNPYRRPRLTPIPKQYYNESNIGIKVIHAIVPAPAKAVIHYLAAPIQWQLGPDYPGSLDNDWQLIVTSEICVYNGVTYLRGDLITIAGELFIDSGTVVKVFVNSNINVSLHEEIARKACINLLLSIKEFDKAKSIVEYFI